jgi:hypothetical protein
MPRFARHRINLDQLTALHVEASRPFEVESHRAFGNLFTALGSTLVRRHRNSPNRIGRRCPSDASEVTRRSNAVNPLKVGSVLTPQPRS